MITGYTIPIIYMFMNNQFKIRGLWFVCIPSCMSIIDLIMFGIFINTACWVDIHDPILNGSLFFAVYWLLYAFVGFVFYVDFVFL